MEAQTIEEVITQLEKIISETLKTNDRIGYFTVLYHKVTCRVRDGINNNEFDDNIRMEKLDVLFANRFLDAYKQYTLGQQQTESWKVTFDASKHSSYLVLQHLLLGMNAHINLDLGIAVVEALKGKNLADVHNDFNKINTID